MLKNKLIIENLKHSHYSDITREKDKLIIDEKITMIYGPNGFGKSSLIKDIKYQLEKRGIKRFERTFNNSMKSSIFEKSESINDIAYLEYDSHQNSYCHQISDDLYYDRHDRILNKIESSEGENKLIVMSELFDNAIRLANQYTSLKQIILFIDGIDSGMSIDMINFMMSTLNLKINQVEKFDVECILIFTTNQYEMIKDRKVLNPTTLTYSSISSYEDYFQQISKLSQLSMYKN